MQSEIINPFDSNKSVVIATNGVLPSLDASLLTNIPNSNGYKKVVFTSSDSSGVVWTNNTCSFTHSLNCIPICVIYDDNNQQVIFDITLVDANTVSVDFVDKTTVENSWKIIFIYVAPF